MKVVKGLLSFLLGILIFCLVLGFSLSYIAKNTIQKELVSVAVKEKGASLVEDLLDDTEIDETTKEKIINSIKSDDKYSKYISIYIDNYFKYVNNENYKVSTSDAKEITDFVNITLKDIAKSLDLEFNEELKDYELVDTLFKTSFEYISENVDEDTTNVIKVYSFVTSTTILLASIAAILVLVLLMSLLIGFAKGIRNLGIISVLVAVLLTILYVVYMVFKKDIIDTIHLDLKLMNLIITMACEYVLGIILIIVSKKIKKSQENE